MQLVLAVFQFAFILAASLYFYSIWVLKTVHAGYVGLALVVIIPKSALQYCSDAETFVKRLLS